jgi:methyl-accepting chemotaxis protein
MMTKILWPATSIMNRLPYTYKFALISVLFLCPIILLGEQLWSQIEKDIQITKREAEGLKAIDQLNTLSQQATQYRDVLMAFNYDRSDATSKRLDKLKLEINNQLSEFFAEFESSSLLKPTQIERLKSAWATSRKQDLGSQIMLREYMLSFGALVLELNAVITEIAKSTALTSISDPEVANEMGFYFEEVRPLLLSAGKLRGYGNNTLNVAYLDSASFTEVDSTYFATQSVYDEFKTAFNNLTKEQVHQPVIELAESTLTSMEQLLLLFNDQVVGGISDRQKWQQFDATASSYLSDAIELETALLSHASDNNELQLNEKRTNRTLLIVSQVSLLILIAYLYLGLYRSLRSSIQQMVESTQKVADGDMTVRVDSQTRDEFSLLTHNFNTMLTEINGLITATRDSSNLTAQQAKNVQALAQQNSEVVQQQTEETRKISRSMEEMSTASMDVAKETEYSANEAEEADEVAREGQQLLEKSVASFTHLTENISESKKVVEKLSERSRGVTDILNVIKGIAEQTNLLALNAAIEAARAGEQGRGFAVVADEVRTLAQRSHQATVEIDEVLGKMQAGVSEAVNAMNQSVAVTGDSVALTQQLSTKLEEILAGVGNISRRTQSISATTAQQTMSVDHVRNSIQAINSRANDAAKAAENTLSSCDEMQQTLAQLHNQLERFTV